MPATNNLTTSILSQCEPRRTYQLSPRMQAHLDWRFVCSGNAGASERESIKGKRKATSTLPIRLLWKRNMVRQQPIRITQQCRPHHMLRVLADNNLADREARSPRVLRASVALEDGEARVFREALSYRGHPMVATHRVAVPKVALESFHIMASAINQDLCGFVARSR